MNLTTAFNDAHEHSEEVGHAHEHSGNFFHDYLDLLTDPSHVAVELTFLIFGEILIVLILLPLIKKYFNFRLDKAHAELDREHGVTHHPLTDEDSKKEK